MNFYVWSKPPAEDIDNFEKLGNPGWNWADYKKYSNKSETQVFSTSHFPFGILICKVSVHLPLQEQMDLYPHTFTNKSGGTSGPIQVIIPPHVHTVDKLFQETMVNRGLKALDDPYGGDVSPLWLSSSASH